MKDPNVPPDAAAPQHAPRPLPLFLDMLRSETAANRDRRAAALAGLQRYQQARRAPPTPPMPVVAQAGRVMLRDYGGAGRPVVFVPSLINPPHVLDLPDTSLLRWLATRGRRVLLVDWGVPAPADRDEDVAAHVLRLATLLDTLAEPPILAGYCLGGTIALGAAAVRDVAGMMLIATPWRFSGFSDRARDEVAALWAQAKPACETLGLVPMEVLQAGFWQLEPARTIAKFVDLATADDAHVARFVALEDWANAGAPLTLAAGRDLFERFFAADETGLAAWRVDGRTVALPPRPVLNLVSTTDRIVPAASAAPAGERIATALGHVGMIVGGRARVEVWEPLAQWLSAH